MDHGQLKARLEQQFGISHAALQWLDSYLSERQQAVTVNGTGSETRTLKYGVPQGSVLGPELFKDYASPLSSVIQSFDVLFHGYADDTQLYISFAPGPEEATALDKIQRCIAAVKAWMAQNYLKLNDDKTEFIVIGSPSNLKKVVTEHILVGGHKIPKSEQVRNIGAIFDSSATMEAQVVKTAQTAWYHLHAISKIRAYLTTEQACCVVHAYVTSRLDQNNSLLSGVSETKILAKLRKVQNAAAKLILGGKKQDHATPLLKKLHWLPVPQRILFKTALLVYKTLQGDGPAYLRELLKPYTCGRGGMRSADDTTRLQVPATQYVTYGDRAFSVFGPKTWNDLPPHVRLSSSVHSFKAAAKKHFFEQAHP